MGRNQHAPANHPMTYDQFIKINSIGINSDISDALEEMRYIWTSANQVVKKDPKNTQMREIGYKAANSIQLIERSIISTKNMYTETLASPRKPTLIETRLREKLSQAEELCNDMRMEIERLEEEVLSEKVERLYDPTCVLSSRGNSDEERCISVPPPHKSTMQ